MESSQQPAEESSPLRSEKADEEVYHSGDEDDTRRNVVQVVESLLIGHHIQVSAGYKCTHARTHVHTQTHTHICCTHVHLIQLILLTLLLLLTIMILILL